MPARPKLKVLGYRWSSSGGQRACPQCAELHGKEFYFKPSGGQLSVDEMPEPPLHPNCRCTILEIVEFDAGQPESGNSAVVNESKPDHSSHHPSIKPYMKDVIRIPYLGLIIRTDGSSRIPIWGKYCGPNWNRGRDTYDMETRPVWDEAPEDDMDARCRDHDNCYDYFRETECDWMLVRHLESLPEDPRRWENPPTTKQEIEDAKTYRNLAIWLFKRKMEADSIKHFLGGKDESIISP